MPAVDVSATALAFAREATAGTRATTGYREAEPNEPATLSSALETVSREPISSRLRRRKGAPTALSAEGSFSVDLTASSFLEWADAILYSTWRNEDVRRIPVTAVVGDGYTLAAGSLTAATAREKLVNGSEIKGLVWAEGFASSMNNGLHVISDDAAAAKVSAGGTEAAAGNAGGTGHLTLAGVRVMSTTANPATFTWSANARELTVMKAGIRGLVNEKGLNVGQLVHFGSVDGQGGTIGNGVRVAEDESGVGGFARYTGRGTANTLVFDRVDSAIQMVPSIGGNSGISVANGGNVDICYTDVVEDVDRDDDRYQQVAHTLRQDFFGLKTAGVSAYKHLLGGVISGATFNMPLDDKATIDLTFLGEDVEPAAEDSSAVAATSPAYTAPFVTTADFARLRITGADDSGLTTDFTSLSVALNPQAAATRVLNRLGPRFISRGILQVDTESQVVFTDPGVPAAIRDNLTTRFDTILANEDGIIAIDIPSQTMTGGAEEYPTNERVLLNSTGQAFEDADYQVSAFFSYLAVPIPND